MAGKNSNCNFLSEIYSNSFKIKLPFYHKTLTLSSLIFIFQPSFPTIHFQKLFANRDYVYNRRYFIDRSRKIIVIANKSTKHPNCPLNPKNQRVHEYWSYMVIRPTKTFKQPGLEFILTYYDNPGIKIPKTVTNWVAQRQMPDFLDKLHQATVAYAGNKTGNVVVPVSYLFGNFD